MEHIKALIDEALSQNVILHLKDGQLGFVAKANQFPDELKQKIRAHKAEIITFLQQVEASQAYQEERLEPITRRPPSALAPISYGQQRLWFIDKLEGGSSQYNMTGRFKIDGQFDAAAFSRTIGTIVDRHQVLRSSFVMEEHEVMQQVISQYEVPLKLIDLTGLDETAQWQQVESYSQQHAAHVFDLAQDVLISVWLLRLNEQCHVMLLNMHHIVSDGWSIGVLVNEINLLYRAYSQGQGNPLAPLAIQYADYAYWQRDSDLDSQLDYWLNQLKQLPSVHNLPLSFERPGHQSFKGGSYAQLIGPELTTKLNGLCRRYDCTLFMLVETVFALLLSRYSGDDDVVVGSPISGRDHKEVEPLIGLFLNTLVLRSDLSENLPFNEFLEQNKRMIRDAFKHQMVPFDNLVEALKPERSLSHSPIFQVTLTMQNNRNSDFDLSGVKFVPLAQVGNVSKFDLEVDVGENDDNLLVQWTYCSDLFSQQRIESLADSFALLLEEIVEQPQLPVGHYNLLAPQMRSMIVDSWNETAQPLESLCIHQFFERQVASTPDALAVQFEQQRLSYHELNEVANRLAHYLIEQGVKPDTLVGLCFERSVEMVVAIVAVLKAGGAYLPLDPDYPRQRLSYMLDEADVAVVLSHNDLVAQLGLEVEHLLQLNSLDDIPSGRCENPQPAQLGLTPNHLAYVIFTSGSTGKPKGVMIEHQALLNRIDWMQKQYHLGKGDRVLQKTPYSFDVSVWEFVWPLFSGAALVLAKPGGHKDPAYLMALIADSEITVLHFVPSMLGLLLAAEDWSKAKSVRQVFCSGEALPKQMVQQFFDSGTPAKLDNLYGPTEAAIDVSYFNCTAENCRHGVPIGKPIQNIDLYVVDRDMAPVPVGVVGELMIGGTGLARGYFNRADLTAEKFVDSPFKVGERLYHSGDLVRFLDDGNIEYVGRTDHQVKLRGFRIELGEIESVICDLDWVDAAVVVALPKSAGLAAYVVGSGGEDSQARLRTQLNDKLPEFMMPAVFVMMESLPLTASGKVNRRALPQVDLAEQAGVEYRAPTDEVQTRICDIWQQLLKVEQVGLDDNFFALGGHSLLVVRSNMMISQAFDIELSVADVFGAQTVDALATIVRDKVQQDDYYKRMVIDDDDEDDDEDDLLL